MSKALLQHHPTAIKVSAIEQMMTDLKLEIEWDGYNMIIHDFENGVNVKYCCNESESVSEFPYKYDVVVLINEEV